MTSTPNLSRDNHLFSKKKEKLRKNSKKKNSREKIPNSPKIPTFRGKKCATRPHTHTHNAHILNSTSHLDVRSRGVASKIRLVSTNNQCIQINAQFTMNAHFKWQFIDKSSLIKISGPFAFDPFARSTSEKKSFQPFIFKLYVLRVLPLSSCSDI